WWCSQRWISGAYRSTSRCHAAASGLVRNRSSRLTEVSTMRGSVLRPVPGEGARLVAAFWQTWLPRRPDRLTQQVDQDTDTAHHCPRPTEVGQTILWDGGHPSPSCRIDCKDGVSRDRSGISE